MTPWRSVRLSFTWKLLLISVLPALLTVSAVTVIVSELYRSLSREVHGVVGENMHGLYASFIHERSDGLASTVALRMELITNELKILAASTQNLIDLGASGRELGEAVQKIPYLRNDFAYNAERRWSNLVKGAADVSMSIWGYQHDRDGRMDAVTQDYADMLAFEKPFMNAMGHSGVDKGWLYIVGPKAAPLMFMYPWAQMPAIFDEQYPGHNERNWWDFFFPNMVESWNGWTRDNPDLLEAGQDLTTITPFYEDAGGTGVMLTLFYPLWTPERDANYGAAAIDVNIDKIINMVQAAQIGKSGFSFIISQDGDMLGLDEARKTILGVEGLESDGEGVTLFSTNIHRSSKAEFARITMPSEKENFTLHDIGDDRHGYYFAVQRLKSINRWDGQTIAPVIFNIATLVDKAEVYSIQKDIQNEIETASTNSTRLAMLVAITIGLLAALTAMVLALKGARQIRLLTRRASRLADGDFESRVDVVTMDELGRLALTFNEMTADLKSSRQRLQDHATRLEELVAERTRDLECANRNLENLARIDALTSVYNRRSFDESLLNMWRFAHRDEKVLALIMLDVDHFKKFNDIYGHQKGDACLVSVAAAVKGCARRALDVVCRYGGEEFAVLVIGDGPEGADMAERIRQAVASERIPHEQSVEPFVTVSIGVSCVVDFATDTPTRLIERADAALYQSKHAGRNQVTVSCELA